MGCDIHEYVELRQPDGTWEKVSDRFGPKEFYNNKNSWNIPRDYLFFDLMAGVRREYIAPIKEPRGVPVKDLSSGVKIELEKWAGDAHTHSYYTLKELLEVKNKTVIAVGFVNLHQYKLIKTRGYPDNWTNSCLYFGLEPIAIVSLEEMDRILNMMAFWDGTNYYTEAIWEHPYFSICPYFWESFVPAMQKLDPNPDNVRFIFWFDN